MPGDAYKQLDLVFENLDKCLKAVHCDWSDVLHLWFFSTVYDEDFLKVLGEPWTGVRDAERILSEEANRQGRSLDEVRSERQRLYDRWVAEQAREEAEGAASRAQQWPASTQSGG